MNILHDSRLTKVFRETLSKHADCLQTEPEIVALLRSAPISLLIAVISRFGRFA